MSFGENEKKTDGRIDYSFVTIGTSIILLKIKTTPCNNKILSTVFTQTFGENCVVKRVTEEVGKETDQKIKTEVVKETMKVITEKHVQYISN